ncbi:MAG: hypothetical protein ACRCST_04320 [Turicibacter sp.]
MKFVEIRAKVYDKLVQDAERYRWLRQGDNDELVRVKSTFLLRNEELDQAIDKEMDFDASST